MNTIKDILIDEGAFELAASEFDNLASEMQTLRNEIDNLLAELKTGFDTPAGEKFFNTCGNNLLKPLIDQAAVINHVAGNLRMAKNHYQSVFNDYNVLNNTIINAKQ